MLELPLPGPPATDDRRPPTPLRPNSPLPMTPATPTASSTPRTDLGPPIPFPDLPPPQPVETPETAPREGPPVTPPPSAEPAEQPTPPAPRRSERARRAPERLIMNCAVEAKRPEQPHLATARPSIHFRARPEVPLFLQPYPQAFFRRYSFIVT